jgi:putative redox protein
MFKEANLSVDNLKIVGQLYLPEQGKGPFPGVILCHGIPSGSVDPSDGGYPLLAQTISAAGLAVYTFRFRGSGESEGNFGILGWQRDLQAAIDYMQKARHVQKSQLALVGFSAGAALAICMAAGDKRVTAVAACASPMDFSSIFDAEKAQFTVAYFRKIGIIRDANYPPFLSDWLNDFRRVEALACVSKIAPRPLLLLHSQGDKVVPVSNSQKLFEKAGQPKQIQIFTGDEHRLRKHEEAVRVLIAWLGQNL